MVMTVSELPRGAVQDGAAGLGEALKTSGRNLCARAVEAFPFTKRNMEKRGLLKGKRRARTFFPPAAYPEIVRFSRTKGMIP